jgi:hypothetical protein
MTSNPRAKNRPQTRAATDENGLAGEFPSPFSRRPIWVLSAVAMAAGACSAVHAQVLHDTYQLAPAGYSGAINTPTADVIRTGSAVLALSNSIPERRQLFPGHPFGGFNLGLGLLPGLEVVGRLVFDGDLQCNQFDRPRCQSRIPRSFCQCEVSVAADVAAGLARSGGLYRLRRCSHQFSAAVRGGDHHIRAGGSVRGVQQAEFDQRAYGRSVCECHGTGERPVGRGGRVGHQGAANWGALHPGASRQPECFSWA